MLEGQEGSGWKRTPFFRHFKARYDVSRVESTVFLKRVALREFDRMNSQRSVRLFRVVKTLQELLKARVSTSIAGATLTHQQP